MTKLNQIISEGERFEIDFDTYNLKKIEDLRPPMIGG